MKRQLNLYIDDKLIKAIKKRAIDDNMRLSKLTEYLFNKYLDYNITLFYPK